MFRHLACSVVIEPEEAFDDERLLNREPGESHRDSSLRCIRFDTGLLALGKILKGRSENWIAEVYQ